MTASNQPTASGDRKPKLLDQVRQHCRLRHLALSTEHQYVGWIRRFILFHVRTTQIYTHVLKMNGFAVKSPADKLWASALALRRQGGAAA